MSVLPREEECGHLTTTEEDNVTGTTQLQSIYLSLWLSKVISHKAYLIIKCCVSHKSFEYCAESENRMLVRGQNGSKCAGHYPHDPWLPAWERSTACRHLAQEKDQIQKLKYSFYWMWITFASSYSQKVVRSNHHKYRHKIDECLPRAGRRMGSDGRRVRGIF